MRRSSMTAGVITIGRAFRGRIRFFLWRICQTGAQTLQYNSYFLKQKGLLTSGLFSLKRWRLLNIRQRHLQRKLLTVSTCTSDLRETVFAGFRCAFYSGFRLDVRRVPKCDDKRHPTSRLLRTQIAAVQRDASIYFVPWSVELPRSPFFRALAEGFFVHSDSFRQLSMMSQSVVIIAGPSKLYGQSVDKISVKFKSS